MEISAKVDYGTRALLELTAARERGEGVLIKGEALAAAQNIPAKFLEGILGQLRAATLVVSQRGADGGYRLARDASMITVADVVRALDGPLAAVRGLPPEDSDYPGAAEHLREVWVATRAAVRSVLETTTLADIHQGRLPTAATTLLEQPGAWERR